MTYVLNRKGEVAVMSWLIENAPTWDVDATIFEIDRLLADREDGESLEIEMRGPRWKGWNQGLIFFTPAADEVDWQPTPED